MFTVFRWLLRILTGAIVLTLALGLLAYWFLSRSLVDYSEEFALPGLQSQVEIVRNNDSVPHIFGTTDRDVFFALGFVHAQDRLWQMTMLRRTAQGGCPSCSGRPRCRWTRCCGGWTCTGWRWNR